MFFRNLGLSLFLFTALCAAESDRWFTKIIAFLNDDVTAILVLPNGDYLAAVAEKGLFRSEDSGNTWTQFAFEKSPSPFFKLTYEPSEDRVYVVRGAFNEEFYGRQVVDWRLLREGALISTNDMGKTWRRDLPGMMGFFEKFSLDGKEHFFSRVTSGDFYYWPVGGNAKTLVSFPERETQSFPLRNGEIRSFSERGVTSYPRPGAPGTLQKNSPTELEEIGLDKQGNLWGINKFGKIFFNRKDDSEWVEAAWEREGIPDKFIPNEWVTNENNEIEMTGTMNYYTTVEFKDGKAWLEPALALNLYDIRTVTRNKEGMLLAATSSGLLEIAPPAKFDPEVVLEVQGPGSLELMNYTSKNFFSTQSRVVLGKEEVKPYDRFVLRAIPNPGAKFVGWENPECRTKETCTGRALKPSFRAVARFE